MKKQFGICAFCNKFLRHDKGICAKCEDEEKAREKELKSKWFTYHDSTEDASWRINNA